MKISELRIGNYVNTGKVSHQYLVGLPEDEIILEDGIFPICSIHSDDTIRLKTKMGEIGCFKLSMCNPIKLTEEQMIKMGAIKDEEGIFSYIPIDIVADTRLYLMPGRGLILTRGINCPIIKFTNTEYVHELQNLYYDLKRTELTYKLSHE